MVYQDLIVWPHDWPNTYIPQCTVHNKNVHISVLNGALWDKELVGKVVSLVYNKILLYIMFIIVV